MLLFARFLLDLAPHFAFFFFLLGFQDWWALHVTSDYQQHPFIPKKKDRSHVFNINSIANPRNVNYKSPRDAKNQWDCGVLLPPGNGFRSAKTFAESVFSNFRVPQQQDIKENILKELVCIASIMHFYRFLSNRCAKVGTVEEIPSAERYTTYGNIYIYDSLKKAPGLVGSILGGYPYFSCNVTPGAIFETQLLDSMFVTNLTFKKPFVDSNIFSLLDEGRLILYDTEGDEDVHYTLPELKEAFYKKPKELKVSIQIKQKGAPFKLLFALLLLDSSSFLLLFSSILSFSFFVFYYF